MRTWCPKTARGPARDAAAGQALLETVFLIPLLAVIVIAIAWFAQVLITRQQLVSAARYGTDMIAYTTLSEQDIREEIRNYLSHRLIRGRKLDPDSLVDGNIKITINDFPRVSFYAQDVILKPGRMAALVRQALDPMGTVSSVEIFYAFDVPRVFYPAGKKKLVVSARSEILSGTGCRDERHKRR